jgi:hypothetical protein
VNPCICGHAPEQHDPECTECDWVHYEDAGDESDDL